MLGPHVVGHRVVVRRVVRGETGPSGGPALTDVLGTCTAWGDGFCVIAPDGDGPREPVTIAITDIVSGKPVPPRASPRHRVTPQEAHRRALALWPDLEVEPLGDWLLRRSATSGARRANSVLAMAPSGVGGDYDRVLAFYAAHGQRPIAAVLPDSTEDALFRGHGWVPESADHDTVFELAGVAAVARRLPRAPHPARLSEEGGVVTARIGADASGVAAAADDWVGFRSIEVSPDRRRSGLGLSVMAALVGWAAEKGARTAYLQVLADNVAALGLYERLGFAEHHRYRYLAAPR
jgi:N-acetylglutamate synthase